MQLNHALILNVILIQNTNVLNNTKRLPQNLLTTYELYMRPKQSFSKLANQEA